MCGFLAVKNYGINFRKVGDLLNRRGLPGYEGDVNYIHNDNHYSFIHRSLPFVTEDPDEAIQPFYSSDRKLPGVFVGEIFNYDRDEYETDIQEITENFYNSGKYEFHNYLHSTDGFFTFVGIKDDHLIGYTDHLGIKPLYYRTDIEAMASDIDSLKVIAPVTPDKLYLSNVGKWGYDPNPNTPWNEIKQVPPGHFVCDGLTHLYWDWNEIHPFSIFSDLKESVERRLTGVRDVPLLLSGGLDSSIIYALMKNLGETNITCIHIDNEESKYVEELIKDDDVLVPISIPANDKLYDRILKITASQTPVDLGSTHQQIEMGSKLRELGFNAVMTGDGADELFGGYKRAKDYDSQYSDVFCELPYYHLPKLDRCMMWSTVELRAPFLSPKIVKHALLCPYGYRDGIKKVLKKAFKDHLPKSILDRDKLPLKTKDIRDNPLKERYELLKQWKAIHYEHFN